AHPDVDDDVEHRPTRTGDVFGLTRRQLSEVQAAQHSGRRHRSVGLPQVETVPGERGELAIGKPLQKQPTGIGMLLRGELPGTRDGEFAYIHVTDLARCSASRRRLSVAPTRIR